MLSGFKKFVFILMIVGIIPFLTIKAYEGRQLSQYAKELTEKQEWVLNGSVELTKQQITTIYNGVTKDAVWNNHTVQWLSVPKENTAVQTVVWSDGSVEEWKASNVLKTAKNYEETHPGYIVIGAVNGDFFYINTTQEPLNYHVQEGDVLRAAWDGDPNWGVIGFVSSKSHLVGLPSKSASMYLKKITDEATTELAEVSATNVAPGADGVYVYTKHLSKTVDLTGYTVYKVSTTLYRDYRGGYFAKGKVLGVENITSLSNVPSGTFYIATKSVTLNVDEEVKVEYNLTGSVVGAENVVGYCYPCLNNSLPMFQNISPKVMDGYFTTLNPRTLVGFKADGSVVLMVIDGRGSVSENLEGATLFQCGELLRLAGCVEGYNLDGGGSSTMMARINGELTLINDPSDARQTGQPWGTLRGIGNAILLVMKDPKIEVEEAVGNTITVKRTGEVVDGRLENIKVNIDNKTYDLTGDELTITGLDKATEYEITYEYDIVNDDGSVDHGISETFYRTTEDYAFPELKEFVEHKLDKGTVTLKYKVDAEEEDVKRVFIKHGSKEIALEGLSGRIKIEEIDTEIENEFKLMAELSNGDVVELGVIKYEANTIPALDKTPSDEEGKVENPTDDSTSGCKKEAALLVVSLISLASLLALFRKKK
ncbi:MAG: phosphodiester glycosidase family protein [Bacilli bacterium]|nr:phosphodiester glycosidase family protein [Bacilli bacterium]